MMNVDPSSSSQAFDYVIVGAGAAGCILANRLSANPSTTVCLIEAGPVDRSLYIRMPVGFVKLLGDSRHIWDFPTEPTELTAGRSVHFPQGKTLGGGTSVNGMAYNRGQRQDFDGWAAAGNKGWGYDDLLPIFKDLESKAGADPNYHGTRGPLAVTDVNWRDQISDAFINAAVQSGIPRNPDINGARQEGVAFSQVTVNDGRRVSTASAFLHPVMSRANLRVITDAMATQVLFEGKRATGIRYTKDGAAHSISARREVILSCGAINTPRLLQVSGVGDPALLASIGVPVVHGLPGVGANFHDHYMIQLIAQGKNFVSINQLARPPKLWQHALLWALHRNSVLNLPAAVAHYFIKSGLNNDVDADIQGVFTPASHITNDGAALDNRPGMTTAFWPHRPMSRGHVRATSSNVMDAPIVQPNYMQAEIDQKILIAGARKAREIFASEALKPYYDIELLPGKEVQSDDEWLDYAKRTGSTVFHPVGTAKMGPQTDPTSVVDDSLRVHGLQGLRVIDASVMPTITSANTAAATMVIGERGARMILSNPS